METTLSDIKSKAEEYMRWDPVEETKEAIQTLVNEERWEDLGKRMNNRLTFGTAGRKSVFSLMCRVERKNGCWIRPHEWSCRVADGASKDSRLC